MRPRTPLVVALIVGLVTILGALPGMASHQFEDVPDSNIFHGDIDWLKENDITRGCNPPDNTLFCPDDFVTRGQMAAFFVRALGLTDTTGGTDFTDTDNHLFEGDILRLSAAGITRGCNPPANDEFCPDDFVTRGQMAAFFVRALGLTDTTGGTDFTDTDNHLFEGDILRLSAAGITRGCNPPANDQFCPDDFITREQMAAFFHRADSVGSVPLRILALNDFHGNINTTGEWLGKPVGRADYLATYIRNERAEVKNSIFVSAGDLIGASPLVSALFQDEPTIEAMNLIGLELNAVGNHEFDEGPAELRRMQNGGAHPTIPDADGEPFTGADFQFLAANVTVDASGDTLFPPYSVKTYWNEKVAFIGMTLEGTPTIVTQEGVAGLTFHDEVETVNALVPELQAQGIEAIVVLLHEGGFSDGGPEGDECLDGLTGPLADIVAGFDDAVDLVIAGHVNDEFVCEVDGKWVTMADNAGRLFTEIDVRIDRGTGDLEVVRIDNVPTYHEGQTAAEDLTELITKYEELSAEAANQVIGTITADIPEDYDDSGESPVGNLIADAQLAATQAAPANAVVAFMNPGGIRTDAGFVFAPSGSEGPGEVTYGEAFAVQPFGNSLVTMTLTGAQIETLLEQQWEGQDPPGRVLQVSEGFSYTWDPNAPVGDRVDPATITIDGTPIDLNASYRVTVNSFLADGGDNFVVLREGTDRVGGDVDLDALVDYFAANSPIDPPATDRIDVVAAP